MDSGEVVAAAVDLSDAFNSYTLQDIGPALTCSEVEALRELLRAVGADGSADILIRSHADSDDDDDSPHSL